MNLLKKLPLLPALSTLLALLLLSCSPTHITGPALDGYCVVCYTSAGKAVKGTKEFSVDHKGKTYYFTNQDTLDTFQKDPEKFLPQYDGWCAYGMTYGKKVPIDPTIFTIVDNKLYLNKSERIGKKFDSNKAKYIAKADEKWKKKQ